MSSTSLVPTPPPESGSYSRVSPAQAAADAIPLLVDDTYHVFHLTTPPFTRHHPPRLRSTWWRMRSKNLVDWTRDAEPSIKPSDDKTAPDADGAWTGAAVLGPDGTMNIFYTGYNLSDNGKQVILRAKSSDRHGTKFQYPGYEITFNGDGRSKLEHIDFRDPYIFYNETEKQYWMIIASRLAEGPHWSRGCIALLRSTDLDTWTFASEPLYSPNDMFCPECPELFSLPNGKWYLLYSRFHAPNSGTVYRIADSPYGPFRIPRDGSHGRLDGRRWYAAKSCPKAGDPSKRIYFGWTGDYVDEEGKWLWGGDLGTPREVCADENGYLRVEPAAGIEQLFNETSQAVPSKVVRSEVSLSAVGSTKAAFPDLGAAETEDLLLHFDVAKCDAHAFGVLLQVDADEKAHRLQFTPSVGDRYNVALLTNFPPLDDFWADQYGLHLLRPVDGPEIVRHEGVSLSGGVTLILRSQLIEVFCGGRSISFRLPLPVAPVTKDANSETRRLGWFVEDGDVDLSNVSIRHGGILWRTDS
ncbi:uncharacterized protein E0L32_002921 [Thyridium curvatum]|uniref:beta-fructofuranosidase n=1 Tax=Thyridium curvatum TaxID=1093900 RepID=A0A507BM73_9PEZI|nr:uncharacterized protein E0L32_002921 [Thyridium curvatum]TPX17820.1 hypothetical protein E0L32_002921 [Thyridium curvatum]